MAGDLRVLEGITIGTTITAAAPEGAGQVVHHYGRVGVVQRRPDDSGQEAPGDGAAREEVPLRSATGLSEPEVAALGPLELMGVEALRLRESAAYRSAKRSRPRSGESWDMAGCTSVVPRPEDIRASLGPGAAGPTSSYLEGSVAVGIVIVEGPTAGLKFSAAERTKVVAEVQNGLGWLASAAPQAAPSFHYDVHVVPLTVAPDPNAGDLEALWRDPALAALGYPAGGTGVLQYAEHLRGTLGTRWTYVAFFTKYPLNHFAYAFIGGPYLVMDYANDGWGPDNIDRVFAHETGHVFGAPDEYASSGCDCGGAWGRFGMPNGNCENCAQGGGVACLMRGNDFAFCPFTPAHLGLWLDSPLISRATSKVADIRGASAGDGVAAVQWRFHGGDNQRFRLEAVGNGYVRAVARHSGKVLDVSNASTADGTPLVQWAWNGGDNQRFRLEAAGDRDVRLVAKHSGKVVDVSGGARDDGAALIQWPWHGGRNQRWAYRGTPLLARHSGRAIDVRGASLDNGTPVVQWLPHGGANQEFLVEQLGDGYVRLVATHSGKVLDVYGASSANGTPLVQWAWNGGDNQRFRVEGVGDKFVRLIAKHSGKVLDVAGASTADGARIVQWPWHGGDNQRWQLG
ncbi:RICIN domain-containing protein [Streptomyces sp. NPDC004111]|uniref:RICIN domain-containing protein n=1 Tax=Streptomyces sp. NPDC004111 TaxID=3364690 RepID=UPI0036A01CE7